MSARPRSRARALGAGIAVAWAATALLCALAAKSFRPALDDPTPALSAVTPLKGTRGPRLARRVVVVIVDGLRADVAARLPGIAALASRGGSGVALAALPSVSRPGYATILTGVPPSASGVRSNAYRWRIPLDSIPAVLTRHGGRSTVVSHPGSGLSILAAPHVVEEGPPFPGPAWDASARRAAVLGGDLALILIPEVDVAGHLHGATSPEYRQAAEGADARVASISAAMDLSADTLVVVADHGHRDRGGHGGPEPEVLRVSLVLVGSGIRRGAHLADPAGLEDVAPTVTTLLGLPAPGHAVGHTLWELLDTPPRIALDRQRRELLSERLAPRATEALQAALAVRALRAVATAGLIIALAAALTRARRGGYVLPVGPRLLQALALAACVALAIATTGLPLSPSRIPYGSTRLLGLGSYAAAAATLGAVASAIPLARARGRRHRAALLAGHGLAACLGTMGATWTLLWPPFPGWVPAAPLLVLPPLIMMACGAFALGTGLVLSVAAVRADPASVATTGGPGLP